MRLLLDTHVFLWFIEESSQLSADAKQQLEDDRNDLFLSYASIWEMAIKTSLGKLTIHQTFDEFISQHVALNNLQTLPLSLAHVSRVATMPFHHRDPFDRLLAAQSLVEGLPLLSVDKIFDQYGFKRLW